MRDWSFMRDKGLMSAEYTTPTVLILGMEAYFMTFHLEIQVALCICLNWRAYQVK